MQSDIKNYLDNDGKIKVFPSKRKNKYIILEYLKEKFEYKKEYTEKEVNDIIDNNTSFKDAATIRREMYDHKIFDRTIDCKTYILHEEKAK